MGCDAALKIVNSALLLKSGEETLATADVAAVDLFTGRAEFYKAGAAPTFLVKNGRAGYVQSDSLPAGILEGAAFEKSSLTLRRGTDWCWCRTESQPPERTGSSPSWKPGRNSRPSSWRRTLPGLPGSVSSPDREDDITVLVADLFRAD